MRRKQIWFAELFFVPVLESGKVSTAARYHINDLPESENVIGDANNRHLGILKTDCSPKPALKAIAFFQKLFGNGVTPADEKIRVTSSLRSDAETHAFINQRGELVIVSGLKIITPHLPFSENGNANDSLEERLRFQLPEQFKGGFEFTTRPDVNCPTERKSRA